MERIPRSTLRHPDGRRLYVYGATHAREVPGDAPTSPSDELHLRYDPLTDAWVGVSPARNTRPLTHDRGQQPACPLCPGGPEIPWDYDAAVFENRFPTLLTSPPDAPALDGATAPSRGRCEVVLYTSTHAGSLATLTPLELARVVAIWCDRSADLWAEPEHAHVLIFENRGEEVGATLSHPHGQIYAFDRHPPRIRDRAAILRRHREATGHCLTCEVVATDAAAEARTIVFNDTFTVTVPFAARWPYEVHVRARRHGVRRLTDLDADGRRDLAAALRAVVDRYDHLYDRPVAYMMVCLEAPRGDDGQPVHDWHLAFEFLPPNRGPDKLKVRASVETATGFFINDTVPERTAAELAAVAGTRPDVAIPDVEIVHASDAAGVGDPRETDGNREEAHRS